jgi:hypothetical protein
MPRWGEPDKIPANTIKIIVGFKPNPLLEPDWVKQGFKDFRKAMEFERQIEKRFPRTLQVPPKWLSL